MSDDIVDPIHIPDRGAVGSLDQLVIPLVRTSTTIALFPLDLEDLVPHRYYREDGGDAACSCEEGAGAEGELVRCGNDIDVVHRAAAQRREGAFIERAHETTRDVVVVGEVGCIGGYGFPIVLRAIRRCGSVKFDSQAQQPFEKRFQSEGESRKECQKYCSPARMTPVHKKMAFRPGS